MTNKLLRRPEVEAITHLSRAAIYSKMKKGTFPLPVRLGPNSVAWRAEDIDRWISKLPVASELRDEFVGIGPCQHNERIDRREASPVGTRRFEGGEVDAGRRFGGGGLSLAALLAVLAHVVGGFLAGALLGHRRLRVLRGVTWRSMCAGPDSSTHTNARFRTLRGAEAGETLEADEP